MHYLVRRIRIAIGTRFATTDGQKPWPVLLLKEFQSQMADLRCIIWSGGSEFLREGSPSIVIDGGIPPFSFSNLTVLRILCSFQCYQGISPFALMDDQFEKSEPGQKETFKD
jgi:hypothetical protein